MKAYPRFVSRLTVFVATLPLSVPLVLAQQSVEQVPTTVVAPAGVAVPMEELVAPIALYPDALIALILPASTVSSDVVLAARYLKTGGRPDQVDAQPWDDSVKGLAHYPDVITWMDENLAWTQRIGEAYVDQPQAVMSAIQTARTIARNNGVLVDTPQQQVVVDDSYIRIIPTQPEVIYVPRYDPEIIYVQRPTYYSPDPWLTFGIGFGVGSWLAYDLDWGRHCIWVDHHRHERWRDHHDWRYRSFSGRPGFVSRDPYWRQWQPSPGRPRAPHRDWDRGGRDFARPTPHPGAPHFDRDRWQDRSRSRPERYAGGSRPGVREAWDRSEDQRSRVNHSSGGVRRSSGSSNPIVNQSAAVPSAPVAAVAPPPAIQTPDRQRTSDHGDRRGGNNRITNERRNGAGGSVSVVPSDRRWQQPTVSETPRTQNEGERRRGPIDRSERGDRSIRPAMPNVRSQSVANQPANVQAQAPVVRAQPPVAQVSPPAVRPAPQVREFRQPDRVAPQAAAQAQIRSAPPQVRESQGGDRGSRGGSNDRVSRSEGRGGRDRQPER